MQYGPVLSKLQHNLTLFYSIFTVILETDSCTKQVNLDEYDSKYHCDWCKTHLQRSANHCCDENDWNARKMTQNWVDFWTSLSTFNDWMEQRSVNLVDNCYNYHCDWCVNISEGQPTFKSYIGSPINEQDWIKFDWLD